MRKTFFAVFLIATSVTEVCSEWAYSDGPSPASADMRSEEALDRVTDEAALSAKLAAIKSFERLLSRPENADRKTLILLRLAETLQQAADMDYRIEFYKRKKRNPTGYKHNDQFLQSMGSKYRPLVHVVENKMVLRAKIV